MGQCSITMGQLWGSVGFLLGRMVMGQRGVIIGRTVMGQGSCGAVWDHYGAGQLWGRATMGQCGITMGQGSCGAV